VRCRTSDAALFGEWPSFCGAKFLFNEGSELNSASFDPEFVINVPARLFPREQSGSTYAGDTSAGNGHCALVEPVMNKTVVALVLAFVVVAQPALACGGGYAGQSYRSQTPHAAKAPTSETLNPTTAPARSAAERGFALQASNTAVSECKQYFASIGALVTVPCSG
jgi:hypothetical protein